MQELAGTLATIIGKPDSQESKRKDTKDEENLQDFMDSGALAAVKLSGGGTPPVAASSDSAGGG